MFLYCIIKYKTKIKTQSTSVKSCLLVWFSKVRMRIPYSHLVENQGHAVGVMSKVVERQVQCLQGSVGCQQVSHGLRTICVVV
jgi:hypothetical protein